MPNIIQIGDKSIEYRVFEREIENSRLEIDPDTLEVQIIVPNDEEIDIQKILKEKKAWIYKNYCKLDKIKKEKEKFQLKEGSKLYLLGKEYFLKIEEGKELKILIDDHSIIVNTNEKTGKSPDFIKSQLRKWYRNKASSYIKAKFKKIITNLNFEYNQVLITDLKTRWGNCTPNKNVSYNWKIIFAPPEVIDYVILHEIIHLKESSHSAKFWGLIMRVCPKYKSHKGWLEKNEKKLLLSFL